jgi:hypothetical protein
MSKEAQGQWRWQGQLNDEGCESIDIAANVEVASATNEAETQTDRIKIVHIKAGTTRQEEVAVSPTIAQP